jgi:REP-associated tyrosine transposase
MEDHKRGRHMVWECKYHLVWTTKYPYPVLAGDVASGTANCYTNSSLAQKIGQVNGISHHIALQFMTCQPIFRAICSRRG